MSTLTRFWWTMCVARIGSPNAWQAMFRAICAGITRSTRGTVLSTSIILTLILPLSAFSDPAPAPPIPVPPPSAELTAFKEAFDGRRAPSEDQKEYSQSLELFAYALRTVKDDYPSAVDAHALVAAAIESMRSTAAGSSDQDLVENAVKGMTKSLDQYSAYLTNTERRSILLPGNSIGDIGVVGVMDDTGILVLDVVDDTPAETIDLCVGDHITEVDGRSLKNLKSNEVNEAFRGPVGSAVQLSVTHRGQSSQIYGTRAEVKRLNVTLKIEKKIAYVRIKHFDISYDMGIRYMVAKLKSTPGQTIEGYILDLRSNIGGGLDAGIQVADDFLQPGGSIVVMTEGALQSHARYNAHGNDVTAGAPMIVLVNDQTAGAAELVAAALQDNHRAILLGTTTAGKGSVQTLIPGFPFGGSMRLTTGYLERPSGRALDNVGVRPDVLAQLKVPELDPKMHLFGDPRNDTQYALAIEKLAELRAQPRAP